MPVVGPNGFLRMTLPELIEQAQADIESYLPDANARLEQNNLDVLAISTAGLADQQLSAIDNYAPETHITTATQWGLERHGSEWGVTRKLPTRATGRLFADIVAGTTEMRSGALFQTQSLVQVRTTADAIVSGAGLEAPTIAVDTGVAGNLAAGTSLETVNSIPGITGARVVDLMTGGTDIEQVELWRSRILDRIQRPPQGGNASDYVRWSLEVPGVTRAWCYPKEQGTGTVVVRFAMDDVYADGIPDQDDAATLLEYIEERRPVTAEVFVYAPVPRTIDVEITDLAPVNPDGSVPPDMQAAIRAELNDMLFREGRPGGVLCVNWFWEAVSIASGVRCHKITDPADDIELLGGELPVLGTVTYVWTAAPRRRRHA